MKTHLFSRASLALFACSLSSLTTSCAAPDKTASPILPTRIAQNATTPQPSTPAVAVKLAQNGQALMPIVVAADASPAVKESAETLAAHLKRISGGEFKVETGALSANAKGIAVGLAAQFGDEAKPLQTDDPTKREDYILRSHANGVLLIGASELAVSHAVWDFLYRLGYRQFFPGETWEVVPSKKNLSVAVNTVEHPDYYARRIWFGYGSLPENRDDYVAWNARNRATSGIGLNTGHAYDNIIRRHKEEFEKHPEYLTKPGGNKLCVSNPGLQKLVIDYALKEFEESPNLHSISLDPSDGGGWESDSCPDAEKIGSVTDRVITLANIVAESVTKKYPGKYIGVYAYNEHSPPPTIKVHPNVIPSVATSFIRGGFTLDELMTGWGEKAQMLGIREYYSVNTWDRDLPGRARGGNIDYLKRTVPELHAKNARFLSAESSDNWAPNGLGYYLTSRILWDVDAARQVEELEADFLQKAFGAAQEPMAQYYQLIDGSRRPLLGTDLIGRMYLQLDKAWKATDDATVRARIHDLVLYTRYVELYLDYSQSSGDARQAAFETLMRYTWRIRKTQMVHTLALWRDLANRDKQVKFPAGSGYRAPEEKDPWKSSEPFTNDQVLKFIADGITNNPTIDFEAVAFSQDLVTATPLQLSSQKPGNFNMLRGGQDFYTWVEKAPATLSLQGQGGLIYKDRGKAEFTLYASADPTGESIAQQGIAPDKETHEVKLQTTYPGLHRINVRDGSAGTAVTWSAGTPMTVESSIDTPIRFAGGRWTMYFYVPKGTKVVGGYRGGSAGRVQDNTGKTVLDLSKVPSPGYWSVPVPEGQDGKLWQLYSVSGTVMLMTVPPYLARSADEMLLPAEVVQADAAR